MKEALDGNNDFRERDEMDVWDEYLKESRQNYSHKDSNDIVDSMFNSGTILKKQDIDVEILED